MLRCESRLMRWPQPTAHARMVGLPPGTDMENSKDGSLETQTTVLAVPVTADAQNSGARPTQNLKRGAKLKRGGRGVESQERKRSQASAARKNQNACSLHELTPTILLRTPIESHLSAQCGKTGTVELLLRRENFSGGEFLHGHVNLTCGADNNACQEGSIRHQNILLERNIEEKTRQENVNCTSSEV